MDAKTEYAATKGKNLVVVTTVGGINYGARLQSFALQATLESYGYNAGILGHLPNHNGGKLKRAARTALSINFGKPFVEFMRFKDSDAASQNSRIYDVLSHFGLTGQLYANGADSWLGLYKEANDAEAMGGGNLQRYMPFWTRTGSARAAI